MTHFGHVRIIRLCKTTLWRYKNYYKTLKREEFLQFCFLFYNTNH